MQLTPELIAGLAVALFIVVILLFRLGRAGRGRKINRPVSHGPANLQFICAGCAERFTHTKRTVGAWEKGTRRFYCNACHAKWRGSQPPSQSVRSAQSAAAGQATRSSRTEPSPSSSSPARVGRAHARAGSGSGCLGVVFLLVAVPVAIVVAAVRYA